MAITNGPVERQDVSLWTTVCSATVASTVTGSITASTTGTMTISNATTAASGSSTAGLAAVALGDIVTAIINVDQKNVIVSGYVNVAGTVTISYSNATGGAQTLGAHNVTILVQRFQPEVL